MAADIQKKNGFQRQSGHDAAGSECFVTGYLAKDNFIK